MSRLLAADPGVHGTVADVTNADDVGDWVDGILERWGAVDVLVSMWRGTLYAP